MSAYVSLENFVRFMDKQAWRLQVHNPDQIPLGGFRLQVPGNPNAIDAAICSGRFPGVFLPYPIENVYPEGDPENVALYQLLNDWLYSAPLQEAMQQAYNSIHGLAEQVHWEALFASWRDSRSMRDFFPRLGDIFIDGGSIDNTPSNSAVDYLKEWLKPAGGVKA